MEDDDEFSEEVSPGFPTAVMYIYIRSSSSAAKPREGAYNARSCNGNSKILISVGVVALKRREPCRTAHTIVSFASLARGRLGTRLPIP